MRKMLVTMLLMVIPFSLLADIYEGKILLFSGTKVEDGSRYEYYALYTKEGYRIAVPDFLDAKILFRGKAYVTIRADLGPMACTDMSRACIHGRLVNMKKVEVEFNSSSSDQLDYHNGAVKKFKGTHSQFPQYNYHYYALVPKNGRKLKIPEGVRIEKLLALHDEIEMGVQGRASYFSCPMDDHSCGPENWLVVASFSIVVVED